MPAKRITQINRFIATMSLVGALGLALAAEPTNSMITPPQLPATLSKPS